MEETWENMLWFWLRNVQITQSQYTELLKNIRAEIEKARKEGYADGYIDGEKAGHENKTWDNVMVVNKHVKEIVEKGDEPK